MLERKFKVGDRVVATKDNPHGTGIHKGTFGVIGQVEHPYYTGDLVYYVKFDNLYSCWVGESDLDFALKVDKFKVGDLIKGTNNSYGVTNSSMTLAKVIEVSKSGRNMRIECLRFTHSRKPGSRFWVDNDPTKFSLVDVEDNSKIEIYVEGRDVIAKNLVTGKIGKATCHPDDEFDFAIGAKLAFERLMRRVVKQDSYEIGDKVKIVDKWNDKTNENSDGYMDKYLGSVMTIKEIWKHGLYLMEEDRYDREFLGGWCWNKHCIEGKVVDDSIEPQKVEPKKEEPKFKKGDIVELLESRGSIPKGTHGEFVKYSPSGNCLIDFKFDYGCTHTGDGTLTNRTGRYIHEYALKKVDA